MEGVTLWGHTGLQRVRWQVELAFRRWKSTAQLDELRAKEWPIIHVRIVGKSIVSTRQSMRGA